MDPRSRHWLDDYEPAGMDTGIRRLNQEINNPYALTLQEEWEIAEADRINAHVAPRITNKQRRWGAIHDLQLRAGRVIKMVHFIIEIADAILILYTAGRSFFNLMRKLRQLLPPAKANEIIRIIKDQGKTPPRPNDPFATSDRSWSNDFNPRNITPNSLPVTGGRTARGKNPDWTTFDLDSYRRALRPSTQRPWGC